MVSFHRLGELERSGARAVVVTVVDARGSTPRKAGARMVVLADGSIEGTVGGGAVEHQAIAACKDVLESGQARFVEVRLGQELGMCCGGTMRLFLEPVASAVPFVLLGAGHVARACAQLLGGAGFSIHVADAREGFATAENFPMAATLVDGTDASDLDKLPFGAGAFVLICTHDHAIDQRLTEACLRRPSRWLGLIGSRRKALKTRERCLHKGFAPPEIARLCCPVGLDLGAETPAEIALSIAAEIIAIRRRGALPAGGVRSMSLDLGQTQPTDVDDDPVEPVADLSARRAGPS